MANISNVVLLSLTNNSDCRKPMQMDESTLLYILIVFGCIIAILSFTGNMIIVVVCVKYRELHTPCYVLLANVALGDILYAIAAFPSYVLFNVYPQLFCSAAVQVVRTFIMALALFMSVNNIVIIATDRFVALHFPYFYSANMTLGSTLFAIAFSWVFGSVRASIWAGLRFRNVVRLRYSLIEIAMGSIFLIWTTIVYVQLYTTSKKHLARDKQYGIKKQESKAQAAVLIVGITGLSWIPVICVRLIHMFVDVGVLLTITFLLPFACSALNLGIYTYRLSQYRRCVKKFFLKSSNRIAPSSSDAQSHPQTTTTTN